MTACAIRYRLDGPGPAAFLLDCEGEYRVFARGTLGGVMPRSRMLALLAERGCRWIPAAGEINLDLAAEAVATEQADIAVAMTIHPVAIPVTELGQAGPHA